MRNNLKIKIINNNKNFWYNSKDCLGKIFDTVEFPHVGSKKPDCYYIKDYQGSFWSILKKDVEIVRDVIVKKEEIENKILVIV